MPFENCFYHRRDLGDASIDFERHRFIQHHYDHICISIMIIIIKYLSIDRYTLTRRRRHAAARKKYEFLNRTKLEERSQRCLLMHILRYSFSVTECSLSFKQSFSFSFFLLQTKEKTNHLWKMALSSTFEFRFKLVLIISVKFLVPLCKPNKFLDFVFLHTQHTLFILLHEYPFVYLLNGTNE